MDRSLRPAVNRTGTHVVFMYGLAAVWTVNWFVLLAETTTTPSPVGDVGNIATLLVQLGLSAVFLWQWRDANVERRAAQARMYEWVEKFGPVLEAATETLAAVQHALSNQVDRLSRVQPTAEEQLDRSARELRNAIGEMRDALRAERKDGP